MPTETRSLRPTRLGGALRLASAAAIAVAGCQRVAEPLPVVPPLPVPAHEAGAATPRISGPVTGEQELPKVAVSVSRGTVPRAPGSVVEGGGGGNIQLNFEDTDIRTVAAQILGEDLHATYTIDPAVHGTATLRTVSPLAPAQAVSVLQALLQQNNATLLRIGGVYRVVPLPQANGVAGGAGVAGGMMVPLRYASAEDLAKALQPYAQNGAKIIAVPASNSVVIGGEPGQRDALVDLVRAFDVDELAGQSYALFPVENGSAQDFATAFEKAFRANQGAGLANQVRVLPLSRVNAVLVVANNPRYIEDARRAYAVIERGRRATMRTWHVYYLQNSTANDTAYILQQAFTPGSVTAQPSARAQGQPSSAQSSGIGGTVAGTGSSGTGTTGGTGSSSGIGGGTGTGGTGTGGLGSAFGGGSGTTGSGGQGGALTPPSTASSSAANPLLGGLTNGENGGQEQNGMRIIPNPDNNAVLIYATTDEEQTVEAMLHKVDILPLQVRIDVIIAEVTLNDNLQYGTQWFFRHHSLTGGLSNASTNSTMFSTAATAALLPLPATQLPAFVFGATGKDGDFVLQALQDVTTVKVLSSPDLLVLDNETASLQVGNLVPYQTGSLTAAAGTGLATSTSVNYQQTGVITKVTPRVNSGGLVTLDIAQEVSGVLPQSGQTSTAGSTINSPTFTERAVQSRVVVQDGQTVGLAGLITDNVNRANTGLPWLKDVPILGLIAGSQNNTRTRTELLVLLTPHVLHDQRDARALTEDLRETLPRAAAVPYEMQSLPQGGSADPSAPLRHRIGLGP